ncbi:MAG: GTPase Era [bacterium]|nr:GTPase Era [bacterium]
MPDPSFVTDPDFRSGYIVFAGRPNVGKSTLFNALVGERLSIISAKPQTTRDRILGILTTPRSQMIFLDTPGLLEPRYRLQEVMFNQIRNAIQNADVLLGILDASDLETSFDEPVQKILRATDTPRIVALNKIDLVDAETAKRTVDLVSKALPSQEILPISAQGGHNLDRLKVALEAALPLGPLLYPEDTLTEHPERFFAAELIREELFIQLHQELPYAIAVRIEEFIEDRPKVYIRADVVVERESQKGIVIGNGGKMLRAIGKSARLKIETFLSRPVYLDLHVKVYENWRKKDQALRGFGYLP